ncbi:hypothetical protein ACRZTK_004141 [Enterobacter asburiae]
MSKFISSKIFMNYSFYSLIILLIAVGLSNALAIDINSVGFTAVGEINTSSISLTSSASNNNGNGTNIIVS